ncbi:hypothetical protein GGI02_005246 [Coemansia sp. RSA 2322]|nr:hypothetical protein GGI02_005246 [Coemansia sp. RSA 2322]
MPSAVPSEFDAEIMSIVGRVMGSCTLQDDLTNGAEWRTEAVDSYMDSPRTMRPQASQPAVFGMGDSLGSLSDMSVRRNSVPVNRLARDGSSGSVASDVGSRQPMTASLSAGMEGVSAAYWALEKFRRDKRASSTGHLGQECAFGGSHSAAEIAQMHGGMRESSVWGVCASYAQANPGRCRLNHSERSISLARSLAGVSPGVPAGLDGPHVASPASPHYSEAPRSTPPVQLPVIAEDRMSPCGPPPSSSLQPQSLPRSPLLQSRQTTPGMVPGRGAPMVQALALGAQNGPLMMPQFGQGGPAAQSGMSYSPVAHASPSSHFFGAMAMHGPAPPFSLPSFPQSPLGASSLGHHGHLGDGSVAGMMGPPGMVLSGSGQMFGQTSFSSHQQAGQVGLPWSPTKPSSNGLGDSAQAAMRFNPHHAHPQQQQQHSQAPQHQHQQRQFHQHSLH